MCNNLLFLHNSVYFRDIIMYIPSPMTFLEDVEADIILILEKQKILVSFWSLLPWVTFNKLCSIWDLVSFSTQWGWK